MTESPCRNRDPENYGPLCRYSRYCCPQIMSQHFRVMSDIHVEIVTLKIMANYVNTLTTAVRKLCRNILRLYLIYIL